MMRTCGTGALLLLLAGCVPDQPSLSFGGVEFSGPPGSGEPNLFATSDERVILTWLEPSGPKRHALKVVTRANGAWSAPVTVREGDAFFANWADFPSLVETTDGGWIVHWLEKVAANTYAYHVNLATSRDRGLTWSDPIVPHRDDSPREHGFVSMVPWDNGTAALVWLDGRKMGSADHASERQGVDPGEMTLRATTVDLEGALGPDVLLDERTCECCQTALARTSTGLVAAYRDRSEQEIRNIAVVRWAGGAWTDPVAVHDDGWHYPGCPVNGPQLASSGDTVVVAWFTAPEQQPAAYVAFSVDGGASFGEPVRVDDGDPLGRMDVELIGGSQAIVTWLERTETAAEIRARLVRRGRRADDSWLVTPASELRSGGFPRIARAGDEIVVAWTVPGDEGGVRVMTGSWGKTGSGEPRAGSSN